MAEETTERIYVIPLKQKGYKASIAAPTAVKRVKQYLQKHMKVNEKDIWIDGSLNNELWSKGKYKMPNKVRVKAVKFEDGVVEAYLPELEFEKSRREILQEEKAKKQPILRKEEEMEEEEMEEDVSGTEDYDVVPTADGDVKIKKKKQPKEKEETDTEDEEPKELETPAKPKETKKETPKKSTETKEKKEKASEKTTKKPAEKTKETREKPKPASSEKKETKKEEKSAEKPAKGKKSEEKSEK